MEAFFPFLYQSINSNYLNYYRKMAIEVLLFFFLFSKINKEKREKTKRREEYAKIIKWSS